MPGFDGTGPTGQGPMTGRCQGYCLFKWPGPSKNIATGFIGKTGIPVVLTSAAETGGTLRQRMLRMQDDMEHIRNRMRGNLQKRIFSAKNHLNYLWSRDA